MTDPEARSITVKGEVEVKKIKLLGVLVDTDYKFTSMAKQVAASVRDKTSKLAKVLPSLSKKAKKIVTEAIILSTIDFRLDIWGESCDTQHRVQVAMNGALREMLGVKKPTDAHVENVMKEAEWLNVPN